MKSGKVYSVIFVLLVIWSSVIGQKVGIDIDNQISGWAGFSFSKPVKWQTGARYIPSINPSLQLNENAKIDAGISINSYGNLLFQV